MQSNSAKKTTRVTQIPRSLSQHKDDEEGSDNSMSAGELSENSLYENQAENIRQYRRGGFHPAFIGESYCSKKYTIAQKLGFGTFSTVWLVQHTQNKDYCAMKVQKSKSIVAEAALDEIAILKKLKENAQCQQWQQMCQKYQIKNSPFVVQLKDSFPHFGLNGRHFCSTFDILGPTLLELIQHFDMKNSKMSIDLAKQITRQILIGLEYIHDVCGVIHTDIKPENIMIVLNDIQQVFECIKQKQLIAHLLQSAKMPTSMRYLRQNNIEYNEPAIIKKVKINEPTTVCNGQQLKQFRWKDAVSIDLDKSLTVQIVDFGNACWVNQHFSDTIQTKEYRAPEAIIQARYKANADIWSLACMLFEMLTNNYLFKPTEGTKEQEDDDHLAMIIETIGKPPKQFILSGNQSKTYFDPQGKLRRIHDLDHIALSQILIKEYNYSEQEAKDIEEFILYMLKWNPADRPSAKDVLLHKWLQTQY